MLLAQNGFGKGDLIIRGLQDRVIDGVILSPRDEAPDRLRAHVNDLRTRFDATATILFDPQFYAMTLSSHRLASLPDYYPDLAPGLSRLDLSSSSRIKPSLKKILELQVSLGCDRLVAPSVLISSFRDPWSQIALSMAQLAIDIVAEIGSRTPLLFSLVVDENALLDRDALDEFLDIVTSWTDVAGFYVVLRPNDTNSTAVIQEAALANLLYLTHVLSVVNDYEVIAGYSDLVGTLLHAAGAKYSACGWFGTLRQFSLSRFQPTAGGGRQPRPRYTSGPLLTPILVTPELESIQRVGKIQTVLTNTAYDAAFATTPVGRAPWAKPAPVLHHWATLRKLATEVRAAGSPRARFASADSLVAQAQLTFADLRRSDVGFEPMSGGRQLESWSRGISSARAIIGLR